MPNILQRDFSTISSEFAFHDEIRNSTVLITGSSGLIGSILLRSLIKINEEYNLNINIIGHARNREKIEISFGKITSAKFIYSDIENLNTNEKVDFIFHCAAPTSSRFYVENPVDTINTILCGTRSVLEFAKTKEIQSLVVLSSLESYGTIFDDTIEVTEDSSGLIDPMDVRSSYSLGKKMSECLCRAYSEQYGVAVKVARLTQVFGPGISSEDNRVFAQFSRSIVNGEDIVIHTCGRSAKPYCYTTDTISALFYLIFKGKSGECYNVANSESYISIRDIAKLLTRIFPDSKLVYEIQSKSSYAPVTKIKLNTSKIQDLGWKPKVGLEEMFLNLIEYLRLQ